VAIGGVITATTNSIGFFSQTLLPGRYYLRVASGDSVLFTVPAITSTYLIQSLLGISSGQLAAGNNFRDVGVVRQLLGSDGNWYAPQFRVVGSAVSLGFSLGFNTASAADQTNWQLRGGMLELASTDGNFRAPFVTGTKTAPVFAQAAPGITPFANVRYDASGNLQLCNPAIISPNWFTWFVVGGASAFGPATA
jgi:hypothetical protein